VVPRRDFAVSKILTQPPDLPVFEPFELKFEPSDSPISQASFWPALAKIPKGEAAAEGVREVRDGS
jgi:hypothetical protein